jgi:hypothetical protein
MKGVALAALLLLVVVGCVDIALALIGRGCSPPLAVRILA